MNAVENTVDIPVIPDSEKYVESVLESTFLNSVLALQESLNVIDCCRHQHRLHIYSLISLKKPEYLLLAVAGSACNL
ncbi:hypothetical protein LN650_14145 [Klebsiella pneumoniae subsp. pneumoniae]|nr:hypothetical protein [Klebsiella pneumoniae subsp. pneumoniae]